jgi:hypothetical protein
MGVVDPQLCRKGSDDLDETA